MTRKTRLVSLLLALLVLCSMSVPVFAANACSRVPGGTALDDDKWIEFTVETGSRWLNASDKLTFTQNKGKMICEAMGAMGIFGTASKKIYGAYTIKVTDNSTGTAKEYYWKYKESYTLKLEKNKSYTVSVKAYHPATIGKQECENLYPLGCRLIYTATGHSWSEAYSDFDWYWDSSSYPAWKVTSTKGIISCY